MTELQIIWLAETVAQESKCKMLGFSVARGVGLPSGYWRVIFTYPGIDNYRSFVVNTDGNSIVES